MRDTRGQISLFMSISSDEPNASRSSDDPLLLGARLSGRSTAGSRYTSRSRSQREQSPACEANVPTTKSPSLTRSLAFLPNRTNSWQMKKMRMVSLAFLRRLWSQMLEYNYAQEIDKTATDEVMRAYTSNPRTQEWSEQHSNQSQPEPSSTEVRLL
jgi:hypothetical protein